MRSSFPWPCSNMLTPGSRRAEAMRACFMEAGFTSSLFRTVLQGRGGEAGSVRERVSVRFHRFIFYSKAPEGKRRDGPESVCAVLLGKEGRTGCSRRGWCDIYSPQNGLSYSRVTKGLSPMSRRNQHPASLGTRVTACLCSAPRHKASLHRIRLQMCLGRPHSRAAPSLGRLLCRSSKRSLRKLQTSSKPQLTVTLQAADHQCKTSLTALQWKYSA